MTEPRVEVRGLSPQQSQLLKTMLALKTGVGPFARVAELVYASGGPASAIHDRDGWVRQRLVFAEMAMRQLCGLPGRRRGRVRGLTDPAELTALVSRHAHGSPHAAQEAELRRLLYLLARVHAEPPAAPVPNTIVDQISELAESLQEFLNNGAPTRSESPQLPELQKHDKQMWQLSLVAGKTQKAIADEINERFGTSYTQPRVSEGIARARAHAEASGLASKLGASPRRARTSSVDPRTLAESREHRGWD